jgi:Cu/Ag efflux pump CusA
MLGYGFNALVIAGLAAAVAIVVDEAIAPGHAVVERLRGRRASPDSEPTWVGVQQALATVHRPLIYAGIIALLAILPVAVLEGRPGAFFTPMVLAYAIAVVAALIIGVTVGPALSSLLFARWEPKEASERGPVPWLGARYRSAVQRFSGSLRPALLVTAACGLLAVAILPFVRTALTPTFQDRNVVVRLQGQPDASSEATSQRATDLGNTIRALPGITGVGATVGRAVTGDRVVNVNSSDVWVSIAPDANYKSALASIEHAARQVPGATAEVVPYSTQEMRDVGSLHTGANTVTGSGLDVLTGLNTPLAVRVYGQDPKVLAAEAAKLQQMMATIDGISNPRVEGAATQPTIEIEVDLNKAQQVGISPGDVRRAEATVLQGIQVGSVFEEQKVFDVIVKGTPATRRSVADVQSMLIDVPGGGHVRLGDVADVRVVQTPPVIRRDAVSRRVDVVADLAGRSSSDVVADIEKQLATMSFPIEYHAEVIAKTTADEIGIGRAIGFAIGAAIAALLLFQAAFNSWRLALVATAALPLSLTGGLITGLFSGLTFGLGSLLGLLAILGLAARYITTMLSSIQGENRMRISDDDADTIYDSARESFGSMIISGIAIAALALPIVILGPRPGLEIVQPLALVLLGGVVSSLIVALFLLPAAYLHLIPPRAEEAPPERDEELQPVAAATGA